MEREEFEREIEEKKRERDIKLDEAARWLEKQREVINGVIDSSKKLIERDLQIELTNILNRELTSMKKALKTLIERNEKTFDTYFAKFNERKIKAGELMDAKFKEIQPLKKLDQGNSLQEDFDLLQEMLKSKGANLPSETVFADQGFIFKGELFLADEFVSLKTRVGIELRATIHFVSPKKIGFRFSDGAVLIIDTEDIELERVHLSKI